MENPHVIGRIPFKHPPKADSFCAERSKVCFETDDYGLVFYLCLDLCFQITEIFYLIEINILFVILLHFRCVK